MNVKGWGIWVCLVCAALASAGCESDSGTGSDMVTIRGTVRNVDTGLKAAGVRVRLHGTNFVDNVPTGADGRYQLRVPRGSVLRLHTDDFDPSQDMWFPLINSEGPGFVATENISEWAIHCCPQTSGQAFGSVAVWDNFLANSDDQMYGDMFVPAKAAESGGNLVVIFAGCENGAQVFYDSLSVTTGTPAFPVGYVNGDKVGNLDPALGPDILYFPPQDYTGWLGWVFSWGDVSAGLASLSLTIADRKPGRSLPFPIQFDVPVSPGTITLVLMMNLEGVHTQNFDTFGRCVGFPLKGVPLVRSSQLVTANDRNARHGD